MKLSVIIKWKVVFVRSGKIQSLDLYRIYPAAEGAGDRRFPVHVPARISDKRAFVADHETLRTAEDAVRVAAGAGKHERAGCRSAAETDNKVLVK